MENLLEALNDLLRTIEISTSDFVKKELCEFTESLFPVLEHCIANQSRILGMNQKLKEFFQQDTNRDEFESQLHELICAYFIENQLNHTLKEIEVRGRSIVAPTCTNGKSCDLKSEKDGQYFYWESKRNLAQDQRPRERMGEFEGFTPVSPEETTQWLRNKLAESNKKGANYLLVRLPFWSPSTILDQNEKYMQWVERRFPGSEQVSRNHFKIRLERLRLQETKSFYVMFPNDHVRIDVQNQDENIDGSTPG